MIGKRVLGSLGILLAGAGLGVASGAQAQPIVGVPHDWQVGFPASYTPLMDRVESLNDLLLVFMVTTHKPRMPLYAATAVLGSLAGCLVLYYIGRRGGAPLVNRRFSSGRVSRSMATLQRYRVRGISMGAVKG